MTLTNVHHTNTVRKPVVVDWDDAFSGKFPVTRRAMEAAAAQLQQQPGIEQSRLARGLELALAGKVEATEQGHIVRNGSHVYHLGTDGCTCKDAETNSRYCKHYLAMLIVTRAQAETAPGTVDNEPEPEEEPDGWTQAVLAVAARASQAMPASKNHIAAAVDILLDHDCIDEGNGRYRVGAADDPELHIVDQDGCDCADADQQPGGWCRHRFAAVIFRKAQAQLPPPAVPDEPEPEDDGDEERYEVTARGRKALVDSSTRPGWTTDQAPSSVTMKWQTGGVELMLTLRDATDDALFARIKQVLPRIHCSVEKERAKQQEAIAQAQATGQPMPESWCPVHQVEMQRREKDGRHWYSHRTDDGWCRGK